MSVFYRDGQITLHHGRALDVARTLATSSVDAIVTSPPYWGGLRDYGEADQYGLEETPAEYVERLRRLFRALWRVLADDGTLWLVLGDSYAGSWGNQGRPAQRGTQRPITAGQFQPGMTDGRYPASRRTGSTTAPGMPAPKNLIGVPWRVALALQQDGWLVRNDIIWHKNNALPESVADRLANRHEHIFLLAKQPRYWFNLDAIRDTTAPAGHSHGEAVQPGEAWKTHANGANPQRGYRGTHSAGRNPGDVWPINITPFSGAHFAVFPVAIPQRCILAGCKPGGTVLDPFNGAGTTGLAAARTGRKYVGIDLSADYLALALRTRLATPALDLDGEPDAV